MTQTEFKQKWLIAACCWYWLSLIQYCQSENESLRLQQCCLRTPSTESRCYNEWPKPVIMIFLEFYFAGLQAVGGASWAQSGPTLAAWKHFLCNGFIFNIHIKYSFMLNNQNIVSVYLYPGSKNKYIVNLPYPGPILYKPHSIFSLLETHSTEDTMSRAPSRLMER